MKHLTFWLVAALTAACGKSAPTNCERAVKHVMDVQINVGGSKPSREEMEVIREVERMTVPKCEAEGLTAEQRDCILAIKSIETFEAVFRCPAIVAKRPSWLIGGAPPPDLAEPPAPTDPAAPADAPAP